MIKQEHYPEEFQINTAVNQALEEQHHNQVNHQDLNLRDELKPLWVACYFEKRLSKIQI